MTRSRNYQTYGQTDSAQANLCSTCVSFGWPTHVDLRWLALTLFEHKFVPKSTQVFHRLVTQRKSTQVDRKSSISMCMCNARVCVCANEYVDRCGNSGRMWTIMYLNLKVLWILTWCRCVYMFVMSHNKTQTFYKQVTMSWAIFNSWMRKQWTSYSSWGKFHSLARSLARWIVNFFC